ncbi:Short-chain fatty acids transporter [Roseivivax sp. THAF40]|uniref:short-chain fatty acid transporter n=1 Tax=unclassified Roseivivax TaxID=2639302 RepID=UPI0012680EBC|nr:MULTISPECIES: short-chain fatty acid transporter [unclassified Roseivivax]QFS82720.1 Short-chain fatty acids transporter [Roseivivax sp. THAF197b]QFT46489.1 Short-chain fatty acids transporter [Roseivivax sp. THAF40]
MLNALSRPMVRVVDRYLPDPFVFVMILTLVAAAAAFFTQGTTPLQIVEIWGDGFWSLLTFSMQMLLVLVTGYMMASTPLVKGGLAKLAGLAASPGGAILLVSFTSLAASWINWGFGLVVGALFAKELARQIKVDYRLLVASAYSGFIVWHGGLAGSVPLSIATEGHPFQDMTGVIPTSETIFSPFNLAIVVALFIAVPFINRAMMPKAGEEIFVDPELLKETETQKPEVPTPADRLEHSPVLTILIGVAGLAWTLNYFMGGGGLSLNVINFLFLSLAILLHGSPRNLLNALQDAVKGGAGIVIQFPFYAGIMAIMVDSGLAASISEGLIGLASATTLPFWTFLSAGIVNFFVPSGGGQWAVQAPVILPAAEALGLDMAKASMAVAWGDAWTNMVQPFWALPILGIAGLRAKDIMGFCIIHLILSGAIIVTGLTLL